MSEVIMLSIAAVIVAGGIIFLAFVLEERRIQRRRQRIWDITMESIARRYSRDKK